MKYRIKEFHKDDAYCGHWRGDELIGTVVEQVEGSLLWDTFPGYVSGDFKSEDGRTRCFYAVKLEEVTNEGPEEVSEEE